MNVLHNNPVDCLFILAVDSRSLDELGLDPLDGIRLVVSVEVDGERVDHFECCFRMGGRRKQRIERDAFKRASLFESLQRTDGCIHRGRPTAFPEAKGQGLVNLQGSRLVDL